MGIKGIFGEEAGLGQGGIKHKIGEEWIALEMHVVMFVLLLLEFVLISLLRRNLYRQYMKRENGKIQSAGIKEWKAQYYWRPTRYILRIEYMEKGRKIQKTVASSCSFLEKYRDEEHIGIVTVPGTDFIFWEEDNMWKQNAELAVIIFFLSVMGVPLLLAGLMEILFGDVMYRIADLLVLLVVLLFWRSVDPQPSGKHRSRMKFVTALSGEEVIEKFIQMASGSFLWESFHFDKEKEDIRDKVYLLSIDRTTPLYWGCMRGEARYRVLVSSAQEGSAVWLYLLECSNDYALNRFAERVERFLKEEIRAVRAE